MSNKCPYCGGEAGKSHDPCPYAPGGKKSKTPKPASREFERPKPAGLPPDLPAEPAPNWSWQREEQDTRKEAKQIAETVSETFSAAIRPDAPEAPADGKRKGPVSHPDCEMCAANREKARLKMRRLRKGGAE